MSYIFGYSLFSHNVLPIQDRLHQIQESVPEWISRDYAWSLDFSSALSSGYICQSLVGIMKKLVQSSITVEHGHGNWDKRWALLLWNFLQMVFADLLQLKDVQSVVMADRRLFDFGQSDDMTFELYQTDIAGFFNQVEHSRIFDCCSFCCSPILQFTTCFVGPQRPDTHQQDGTHSSIISWSLEITKRTIPIYQTG